MGLGAEAKSHEQDSLERKTDKYTEDIYRFIHTCTYITYTISYTV